MAPLANDRHSNHTVAPLTNDRHFTYTVAPLANDRHSTHTVAPLVNDQYTNYDSPVTEKRKSKQNSSEQPDVASRKTSSDKPVGACFKRTKPREAVVIRPRPSSAVAENRKRFNLPSMDYCNCLGVKKSRSANQLVAALNLENPGRNIQNACGKVVKGGGMDTFSNKPMESLKNGRCLERRRGNSLQINAERELRRELRELEEKRERRLADKFSFARAIASENQRYRESIQRLEAFLCRVQGCPGSENSGSVGQVEPTKLSLSLNDLRSAEWTSELAFGLWSAPDLGRTSLIQTYPVKCSCSAWSRRSRHVSIENNRYLLII